MAVDEINAAGGLLGRPLELHFYDSQSNNQFNSQYATQALVQDKVKVIHGGITSSLARGDAADRAQVQAACCSTTRSMRAACATGATSAPAWCRRSSWSRWSTTSSRSRARRRATSWPPTTTTARSPRSGCRRSSARRAARTMAVEFFPLDVTNFAPAIATHPGGQAGRGLVGAGRRRPHRLLSPVRGHHRQEEHDARLDHLRRRPRADRAQRRTKATASSSRPRSSTTCRPRTPRPSSRSSRTMPANKEYVGEYGEYGYRGVMLWAEAVKKAGERRARRGHRGARQGRRQVRRRAAASTRSTARPTTRRWTSTS